MYNKIRVKRPYIRFRKGLDIFMPNHVVFALGAPLQMEVLWGTGERRNNMHICPCVGAKHDPDLTNILPENVRRDLGGHVIKSRHMLEQMHCRLKTHCAVDIFIPGYYTAINDNYPIGAIAQMARFNLNEATPWDNQAEKVEVFVFITPVQEVSE